MYGIQNGFMHDAVQWLPSSWLNVAQWFGLTAFLFCIHSMVREKESVCVCVLLYMLYVGHTIGVINETSTIYDLCP